MSTVHRLAATAVLAAAALFAVASPAHAVANPTVVTTATGPGSPPAAVAVATCPAGLTLVGGGGRIVGAAAGQVTMTDVIPDVVAGTVTVWGNEAGAGTGLNWMVEAVAICDPVVVGVLRVTAASGFNANTPKTVAPQCPAGTLLTGIGYELNNGNGDVFPQSAIPNAALGGATVSAADSGPAGNWSLLGYALCAPLPAGAAPVAVAAWTPLNAFPSKSVTTPNCPAGTRSVGVGAATTGATGNAIIAQMVPNSLATQSTSGAEAFAGFAGMWRLFSYAICW